MYLDHLGHMQLGIKSGAFLPLISQLCRRLDLWLSSGTDHQTVLCSDLQAAKVVPKPSGHVILNRLNPLTPYRLHFKPHVLCWLSSAYDIINSTPSFQSSNLHCSGRCLFKVTSYTSYNDIAEMKAVFLELLQFACFFEAGEIFSTQGLG